MKVTRNWLKQHVDFDWSAEELAERLTMLGLEVEGVEKLGGGFEGIVVAEVITRDKHPNADKLSVCRVNDGTSERQIVCGAQNFKPGDKVPLILPGHSLPPKAGEKEPFVIKVGKIRGVESHGMMCSADELGIDPESIGLRREDGLLILKPDARAGQPFREYLGRGGDDVVYDLEVTPNRPDLNSVLGVAREIAAVTGQAVRRPETSLPETDGPAAADLVEVRIEAPEMCPRYTARVIRGVRIGPSPEWLREALEKVGLRSINNVVDVTNFVMLETGQPLHAFDYNLLSRGADGRAVIVVRPATEGEKFVTLDGKEHTLSERDLLIADSGKGIALAGVMGGRNTEVGPETRDLLLESAYFSPTHIRRTSKALGLRTEASYRFERGADPEAAEAASARAAALILELAGGTLARGVVDAHPRPVERRQISLRHEKVNQLLGLKLSPQEIELFLAQLGLKMRRRPRAVEEDGPPPPAEFEIPSYRVDLKRETDLIEEVARLYGVDRIPSSAPRHAQGAHAFDAVYDAQMEARRLLCGLGLSEAQGQTLISRSAIRNVPAEETLMLENPLSSDMDALRPSLVPGLLDALRHNLRRQTQDVALFEIGRVFRKRGGERKEGWRVAMAMTGRREPAFWSGSGRDEKREAADLKGAIEEFLEHYGVRGVVFSRLESAGELYVEAASVTVGGKRMLGTMGQVHPRWAKEYDLRDPAFVAELDFGELLALRNPARTHKPLPGFPAIRRDVAMVVPESVTHEMVAQSVRRAKAPHLESVDLFDVFRGKHIPEGQKSLAYAFTYRAPDRTLTDAEVNAAHEKVVEQLRTGLGATLRG